MTALVHPSPARFPMQEWRDRLEPADVCGCTRPELINPADDTTDVQHGAILPIGMGRRRQTDGAERESHRGSALYAKRSTLRFGRAPARRLESAGGDLS